MDEIFKIGDDLLRTDANEQQLQAFVIDLKNRYGEDGYNIYDLIYILQKCNFKADFAYINNNVKW